MMDLYLVRRAGRQLQTRNADRTSRWWRGTPLDVAAPACREGIAAFVNEPLP
jgi:hypothetical protein